MTIENNNAKAVGLDKLGMAGLVLGVAGAVWTGYEIAQGAAAAMPSYVFAFVFWLGLTVGCVGLTLLHHTVRGAWGLSILRLLEAGGGWLTIALMGLLSIPILMNLPAVYGWANPEFREHGTAFTFFKFAWLTPQFFMTRIAAYFLIWALYAYALRKSSVKQDENGDASLAEKRTTLSAPGLVVFAVVTTLAYTDLTMSIDPHWFSHIWGFINIAGACLTVFALCNLIVMGNARRAPYSEVVNRGLSKDLGNWMFVFTCLWAYFSYSQYVIIYAGNMPEFTRFFLARGNESWGMIGLSLMAGQFLVPFVTLLAPRVKATPAFLLRIAIIVLLFRIIDVYWTIIPFYRSTFQFKWLDVGAFVAVGGLWLFAFGRQLGAASLLPTHDPRLKEAYEHA